MNEVDALERVRAAIRTVIVAAGRAIGAVMLGGTAVALLQALTQIQAATLAFVPTSAVIRPLLLVTGSFTGVRISIVAEAPDGRIVTGFRGKTPRA